MATTVAESGRRTTGLLRVFQSCLPQSTSGFVVPQQLVQLQLEAHGQVVGNDPVGQVRWLHLMVAGENNTSPARSARLYWISLETAQS
jgi:hypothetical protein